MSTANLWVNEDVQEALAKALGKETLSDSDKKEITDFIYLQLADPENQIELKAFASSTDDNNVRVHFDKKVEFPIAMIAASIEAKKLRKSVTKKAAPKKKTSKLL